MSSGASGMGRGFYRSGHGAPRDACNNPRPMTRLRSKTFIAIAVAALAAGYGVGRWLAPPAAPALQSITVLPAPRALPATMLDLGGRSMALDATEARWTVVFFGFTHCPDVCPTTLALLARSVAMLPVAERPRVLFLSVDPERDAQPKAADYAKWFAPEFVGATTVGLPALAAALGAPYARNESGDGYSMDHSGALFLLDPQGRFAGVATPPHDAAVLAADLAALTAAP
jgi:protein SCO1/2